ncbi:FtsX-like permease family protein [uncultured Algoriphagus sp.]|uniref:ABC transporter permease n=1 Tax=uncultured Algoriphagus sp. TaxID=417365 RepID=UPI00338F600F
MPYFGFKVDRKLGASTVGILTLVSKDFVSLVLISILLAMPMAWYLADLWLESYAFQTDLSWWIFADSSLLLVLIALLTVGYQAFQAARNNPVNSLKSE